MNKSLIIVVILLTIVTLFNSGNKLLIPNEAIRLRVIPNSNSEEDVNIKLKVKERVEKSLYSILKEANTVNEARSIIKNNLSNIDYQVKEVLNQNNYNLGYKVNYGQNFFPEKVFKETKYNEGYYESLVVTIGAGEGDNWWCVLFPPLCLLEAEESDEAEYKFFVQELIDKYF